MPYLRFKLTNPRRYIEVEKGSEQSRLTFDAAPEPFRDAGTFKIIAPKATLDGFRIKGTVYLQSDVPIKGKDSTLHCIYQSNNDGVGENCLAWYEVYVYLSNESADKLMQVDLDKNDIRLDIETPLPNTSATEAIPLVYGDDPDGKELEWHVRKSNHISIVKHSFQITTKVNRQQDIDDEHGEGARLIRLLDEVIASLQHPVEAYPFEKLSQLIREITSPWEKADTEEKRVNLLNIFDLAHRSLLPAIQDADLKKRIEESRTKIYNTFIVSECLIGEHISTQRLNRVTQREIAANRMTKDDDLRKTAEMALAAPYLTEEELLAMTAAKTDTPFSKHPQDAVAKFITAASYIKKIRSVLKLFGI